MPTYETELIAPSYFESESDAEFLLDRIRDYGTPVVTAVFENMSAQDAETRRDDINVELRSRGLPELPPLRVRRRPL